MRQNKEKNIIMNDNYESNKNEEDLLAYSSKYKTNIYKEEDDKENEIEPRAVRKRLSGDSTSISQEYSNISGCNLKKANVMPKEEAPSHRSIGFSESSKKYIEFQEKQRKMSSPLCCYYDGSDIYLSKTQKTTIDIKKSPNFIKKEDFFNNSDIINNNKNMFKRKNHKSSNNLNINNLTFQNQNFASLINENKEDQKNNEMKRLSFNISQMPFNINNINNINNFNNINRMQNNNIINNNFFFQNNTIQQQIFNINYINLNQLQNNQITPINNNLSGRKLSYNIEDGIIGNYFNNILNLNNNNANQNPNENFFNMPQPQTNLNPILFSYNEEQDNFTKYNISKKSSTKSMPNNKNDKKPFDKRKGDWLCPDCHNLNFAFRVICNRCQRPKPVNLNVSKGK